MKRYPAYKDSGVETLGEVPDPWEVLPLKRIALLNYGDALASEVRDIDGAVPVYGSNGPVGRHSKGNALGPAILVGRKGSYGALNWSDGDCFAIDTVYFISGRVASCDIRWLFWTLHIGNFDSVSQDTGVPGLSRSHAHETRFPLPPPPEQRAIADFLDRETAKIDALVEEQRRLIALLAEKRQAVISHAVTRGLNPDAPLKPSGIDWLRDIPEGWEVVPLRRIIDRIESGTSVNATDIPAEDNEIGVLKTSCVYSGEFDPTENKTVIAEDLARVSCPLRVGTVIVSRMNTPDLVGAAGFVSLAPTNIYLPDRLWQVSFLDADAEFIHFWTQSGFYRDQVKAACAGTSSSMQNLSQDDFRSFRLALPPPKEQRAIAASVRKDLRSFAALAEVATSAIALLQERRAALISAAVTGKIDLRDEANFSGTFHEHREDYLSAAAEVE